MVGLLPCQCAQANHEMAFLVCYLSWYLCRLFNSSMNQAARVSLTQCPLSSETYSYQTVLFSSSHLLLPLTLPLFSDFLSLRRSESPPACPCSKSISRSSPSAVFCIHPARCLGTVHWNQKTGAWGAGKCSGI